jgi:hypothetical protein
MVKSLVLMALLTGNVVHAASLTAQLDRAAVALGEPLSLTVQASGLNLDALDLKPLEAGFEVFARTRSRGTDSETLVLTLYPLIAGDEPIPALHLGSRRTAVLPLTVTDGSESVPRVSANWHLEPDAPLVNQPVRLTLAICDDGSLQWRRPTLPALAGRVVRILGEEEGEGTRDGEACTLHRFHWALLATREGDSSLSLPMLDASRFGQRLRFPGSSLRFVATALPAWLPAHVPPLEPSIQAGPLPARWPLGRPLDWRFEVSGGYSADGLKSLLELQLRESSALGLYPPLIEVITPGDQNSPLSHYAVTLFLKPRASGEITLPALHLPWYDQARGRMASMALTGGTLTVFDPRWELAGQVAGGLAVFLLLAGLIWQARRMARWRLARRRGLRAIRQARDVAGLAHAVRQFSLTGQPAAPSLGDWQRRLLRETGGCDVAGVVNLLERQLFGQSSPDVAALQQVFLQLLSRARPRMRDPRIGAIRA